MMADEASVLLHTTVLPSIVRARKRAPNQRNCRFSDTAVSAMLPDQRCCRISDPGVRAAAAMPARAGPACARAGRIRLGPAARPTTVFSR